MKLTNLSEEYEELSEEYLAEKLAALEKWLENVKPEDLKPAPLESYGLIGKWINQFDEVNECLAQRVVEAYLRGLSWSDIGELLGVSAEAARAKYGSRVAAQTAS